MRPAPMRSRVVAGWLLAAGVSMAAAAPALGLDDFQVVYPLQSPAGASGLVGVELPGQVLARLRTADAVDLRVFDARGVPMPHALVRLTPPAARASVALQTHPVRGAQQGGSGGPLRLRVEQRGDTRVVEAVSDGAPDTVGTAPAPSGTFLLDTRALAEPVAEIALEATLPAGRIVTATAEASADLRDWQSIAVRSALVRLDGDAPGANAGRIVLAEPVALRGRWLRIAFDDRTVRIAAAQAVLQPSQAPGASAAWLPLGEPLSRQAQAVEWRVPFGLPIEAIDLRPSRPNALAAVRVLGRARAGDAWHALGGGVAYRLDQPGRPEATGAPLALRGFSGGLLRVESDTAGFSDWAIEARAAVRPLRLVFVAGGTPPYRLAVGHDDAPAVALPVANLIPGYQEGAERALPQATVGQAQPRPQRWPVLDVGAMRIDLRSVLLWVVLLGGVAVLAWIARAALRTPPSR